MTSLEEPPKFNYTREEIDKNSNHKKQIFNIYQAIIFISKYSTQLRLDKQDSSPLLPNHYPDKT